MVRNEKSATRLTEGSIMKKIIAFTLPIFIGNLFQQLYNTADSLIVGNFIDSNALAAVSSSGNLIFLMVGFFGGISMGAGVVVARYYGAEDEKNLQKAVHTMVAFGIAAGIALTAIGIILAPRLLRLMGTPEDVLPNSILYFRIYFAGSLGFVLYNVFVGILQSAGDSRHPLIYLIISSVLNVILDLLFIAVFHLGVGAAAVATIISQFISAILCLRRLMRVNEGYRIYIKLIKFDGEKLKQIIRNGIPAGVQNSIIAIANVVVQSNINTFGKDAMAGCGSYSKIEGFGFLPITCFSMALATFVSQNLGAGQYERVKKGTKFGVICSITMAELIGVLIYIFAPVLVGLFNREPQVINYGVSYARTTTLFYFLLAFSHCMAGILRGAGKSIVPMFIMMVCWCGIRITYISIATRYLPVIRTIFWAYPLTWALSSVAFLIFYLKMDWSKY